MQRAEIRLERLIEDLIQFALVSKGMLALNIQPAEVERMLQGVVVQVERKAQTARLYLETELDDDLPMIWCDVEKIGWVLVQMLDNAIKFTHPGGKIKIEAARAETFVTISVTDTGIGIPHERIAEIFEPFHQLDGSSTRRYGGTGLGLALSNQIIKAHDALIKVISTPGIGSRFEFSLPVASKTVEM